MKRECVKRQSFYWQQQKLFGIDFRMGVCFVEIFTEEEEALQDDHFACVNPILSLS